MQDSFAHALAAFRKEVAAQYQKPEAGLEIAPTTGDSSGFPEYKTGDLIAFSARFDARQVHGFASPKGEVVFYAKGNVGALLRAANLLEPARSLQVLALAERVAWMIGPDSQLVRTDADYAGPEPPAGSSVTPTLARAADGSASLTFILAEPGHTGLIETTEVSVRCPPDYKAVITMRTWR